MKDENYSQPDFYHFSEDSIFLAQQSAYELNKENIKVKSVLDICAGSGIVGLNFNENYNQKIHEINFIEKQIEFKSFIEKNIIKFGNPSVKYTCFFKEIDFSDYNGEDLILCNPPYFVIGKGRPPQNSLKKVCRFAPKDFFYFLGEFFDFCSKKGARINFILPSDSPALSLMKKTATGAFIPLENKAGIILFSYKGKN